MRRVTDHGLRFECSCGARMLGVAPFERLLADGVGRRVWVASEEGAPVRPCPFCHHAMRDAVAGGIAVCRPCQQVFVPDTASGWMAASASAVAAGAAATAPTRPASCSGCGAPWQPDEGGKCRYCRAQLETPVVTVVMSAPGPARGGGLLGDILDAALDLLT